MTRKLLSCLITAGLMVTVPSTAPPATAASDTFTDARGDVGHRMDITKVRINNADRLLVVVVRHRDVSAATSHYSAVYIGLDRGPEPDLYLVRRPHRQAHVYSTTGWGIGRSVDCSEDDSVSFHVKAQHDPVRRSPGMLGRRRLHSLRGPDRSRLGERRPRTPDGTPGQARD